MAECSSSSNISLFDLQRKYAKKQVQVPVWQRGDAWDDKKKASFERTVRDKIKKGRSDILTGCIIYYEIPSNPNVWFISDGMQRTINSQRLFVKLSSEMNENLAEEMLDKIKIPILYMRYESELEAKNEFRRINRGTPLTPKEEARTILTSLVGFSDWENRVINPVNEIVEDALKFASIRTNGRREKKHIIARDDYAMFHRYLSEDKRLSTYDFSVSDIDDPKASEKLIETKLVVIFENFGLDKTAEKVASFRKFITDEQAYIKYIWDNIPKNEWDNTLVTMTPVCFRILLHLGIWRRNSGTPVAKCTEFITEFLKLSKGRTTLQLPDGRTVMVGKGQLSRFISLQKDINVFIDLNSDSSLKKEKKSCSQLPPGLDNAHLKPYSKHGNGKTVPMSSVQNKSDGVSERS